MTEKQYNTIIELLQKNNLSSCKKWKRTKLKNTMTDKLIERINQFNEIKYGSNDNETRIVFATLKPKGTVTTAPKDKE